MPPLGNPLHDAETTATIRALGQIDRFANLEPTQVRLLATRGTRVRIPANWSLIWEKTPADKAYILLDGQVSVRRGGAEIARLGPGDTVGESAIVAHRLRSASVVSLEPLEVLHFTSDAVRDLINQVPRFADALTETTRERLADSSA